MVYFLNLRKGKNQYVIQKSNQKSLPTIKHFAHVRLVEKNRYGCIEKIRGGIHHYLPRNANAPGNKQKKILTQ